MNFYFEIMSPISLFGKSMAVVFRYSCLLPAPPALLYVLVTFPVSPYSPLSAIPES